MTEMERSGIEVQIWIANMWDRNAKCWWKDFSYEEFDEVLKVYNENQSRADCKIGDYFEHVANKEQDMAVEIIIQVGDKAYW